MSDRFFPQMWSSIGRFIRRVADEIVSHAIQTAVVALFLAIGAIYALFGDRLWPDLVVTFLGVLFGALLAFWIERGVAHWQIRRQREIEERRDKEQLLAYMDRVKFELRDNALTVEQLQRTLGKSPHARVDLFRWATRLAASLSVAAYEDLVRSGLQRYLKAEVQSDLFDARQRTVGLKAMVETVEPAIEFYHGYSADEKSADLHLENAKTYSQTVLDCLIRVRDLAYSEASALKDHLMSLAK